MERQSGDMWHVAVDGLGPAIAGHGLFSKQLLDAWPDCGSIINFMSPNKDPTQGPARLAPEVYVHDTTLRSQNAEQLRENGWLRCSRTPQSFKTYIFYLGVWSLEFGFPIREA